MFYKIKALAESGKKITLHYFQYASSRNANGLEEFCTEIFTYERKKIYQWLPLTQPFIVNSRVNAELIKRLNADEAPILLEGLHCAGLIQFISQQKRIVLRMHNEEASYYHHLAKSETGFLKRQYFKRESQLLQRFQYGMNKDVKLACLSETDIAIFQQRYGFQQCSFIPCFIPWQTVSIVEGKSDFCLYHGNISVSENEEAALWLICNVFSKTKTPLVVAGKGISKRLTSVASEFSHISLVNQPTITEINELVRSAHIHVLPSLNRTGVKLKLLNALLNGRFCITNESGVIGSRIGGGLHISDQPNDWIDYIEETMAQPFGQKEMQAREAVLALYNNSANAAQLNELLWHYQ